MGWDWPVDSHGEDKCGGQISANTQISFDRDSFLSYSLRQWYQDLRRRIDPSDSKEPGSAKWSLLNRQDQDKSPDLRVQMKQLSPISLGLHPLSSPRAPERRCQV